jgi:hypothetical protein
VWHPFPSLSSPLITQDSSDNSVLSRLLTTEARLELLEARLLAVEASSTRNQRGQEEQIHRPDKLFRIPEFHHGAGHKVLQYWSRLRVQLTLSDVDVLCFLKDADNQDTRFFRIPPVDLIQTALPLSLASQCLRTWDEILSELPISFVMLLNNCAFSRDGIARQEEMLSDRMQNRDEGMPLSDLPLDALLFYTIAFRSLSEQPSSTLDLSETCFTMALQHLWRVHLEPDEIAAPLMLIVAHIFLYLFARPFHALGMIQSIDSAIDRLLKRTDRQYVLLLALPCVLVSDQALLGSWNLQPYC